ASRSAVDGARAPVMLENLVGNAARHGVAEGTSLHARLDAGHVRLDLRQSGGVPTAVLRALRSAEPPAGRRGLGLWIARRLCDQMGGTVRAADGRGQTWVLRVVLPCPVATAA
ncbi:MAG TPA: ATP-binding protein, partial [Mycobacteriales bacterium]|nr:ATP-binding protein [Mycobacteriales bacterium]